MSLDPTGDSNSEENFADDDECITLTGIYTVIGDVEKSFDGDLGITDRYYLKFYNEFAKYIGIGQYGLAYAMFNDFIDKNIDDLTDNPNAKIFWSIARCIVSYLRNLIDRSDSGQTGSGGVSLFRASRDTSARHIIRLYGTYDRLFSDRSPSWQVFEDDTSGGGASASATSTSGGGSASATSTSGGADDELDDGLDEDDGLDDEEEVSDVPPRGMSTADKINFFLSRAKFYLGEQNFTQLNYMAQRTYNLLIFGLSELEGQSNDAMDSGNLDTISRVKQNVQIFTHLNSEFGWYVDALVTNGYVVTDELTNGSTVVGSSLQAMGMNLGLVQNSAATTFGAVAMTGLLGAWGMSSSGGGGGGGSKL